MYNTVNRILKTSIEVNIGQLVQKPTRSVAEKRFEKYSPLRLWEVERLE